LEQKNKPDALLVNIFAPKLNSNMPPTLWHSSGNKALSQ